MATGKRPFQRASAAETMTAIIREDAEPLAANIPTPVRWVVERCLSKDPAERYDSTRDLYRDLRQAKEHLSDVQAQLTVPTARRRPSLLWICAAAGSVAGICYRRVLADAAHTSLKAHALRHRI